MKLHEIVKVPQQPVSGIDFSKFPELQRFRKAKVENYELFYAKLDDTYLFSIKHDDKIIASIVANEITDFGDARETIQIKRSWVDHAYRNKGYATAIYKTLFNQGFRILSDEELSPESISIWKKLLAGSSNVQMYNKKTQKIEFVSDEIYNEPLSGRVNLLFILEKDMQWALVDNDLLEDYRIHIGTDCP